MEWVALLESAGPERLVLRLRTNVEISYLGDGSMLIKPQELGYCQRLTRPLVRRLLQQLLPSIGAFDAFCLDYFPTVKGLFSSGMDRIERTNLLLENADCQQIHRRLQEHMNDQSGLAVLPGALNTS